MSSIDHRGPAPRSTRLWGRNFLLLWQGQLVSSLGDVAYEIALGFWVLMTTGSTALMGSLMAASTLPRVVVSPFAGVIVDRRDRRWLMIVMDLVRGIAVILVGGAAVAGVLQVWMVFVAGVIIGLGGAFFTPAVSSALPDVVGKDRLVQANSVFSLLGTGAGILGNSVGGFLFQVLGAPVMFLANGGSYLVSAVTLLFTRIPRIQAPASRGHFLADLEDGFRFVWRSRGMRDIMLIAFFLNFFATMGLILLLPLFQRTTGLGPARYGIAMAVLAGGLFAGFLLTSMIHVPAASRFRIFMICGFVGAACLVAIALTGHFGLMIALLAVGGLMTAVLNSFIPATIQMSTPPEMRGKVFSLLGAISQGATPIAMALAGVLAESLPLRGLMAACFGAVFVAFVPFLTSESVRSFLNTEAHDSPILGDIAGP